jgi:hypothetical protein
LQRGPQCSPHDCKQRRATKDFSSSLSLAT